MREGGGRGREREVGKVNEEGRIRRGGSGRVGGSRREAEGEEGGDRGRRRRGEVFFVIGSSFSELPFREFSVDCEKEDKEGKR